jgi:hypothetical protein
MESRNHRKDIEEALDNRVRSLRQRTVKLERLLGAAARHPRIAGALIDNGFGRAARANGHALIDRAAVIEGDRGGRRKTGPSTHSLVGLLQRAEALEQEMWAYYLEWSTVLAIALPDGKLHRIAGIASMRRIAADYDFDASLPPTLRGTELGG